MPVSEISASDVGLLVLRVAVGGVMMAHGAQKLFGWFGGGGIEGTAQGMEAMGFRPGRSHAIAAGVNETASGALLLAGLATAPAGAVAAGTMGVAATVQLPSGFFAQQDGYEYPAGLALAAAALALTGPGRVSLDAVSGGQLGNTKLSLLAAVATAAGAAITLVRRRKHVAAG
jgi:putative oxidoreductase